MARVGRWVAVLLLLAMPLFEAVARGESDRATFTSPPTWTPVADSQPVAAADTPNAATPIADGDNAMLAAIKALHEEVKALEARIAAQEARIAMLERSLDDQRKNARAANQ